jgi:hypothetical protein
MGKGLSKGDIKGMGKDEQKSCDKHTGEGKCMG